MNVLFRTDTRCIIIGLDGVPVGVPIKLNLDVVGKDGFKVQTKLVEHEGRLCAHTLTGVRVEKITDPDTDEVQEIKFPIMEYLETEYELIQPDEPLKWITDELSHLEQVEFYCMEKNYLKLAEISLPNDPPPHEIRQRVRILNRWKRRYEKMVNGKTAATRQKVLSKVPG